MRIASVEAGIYLGYAYGYDLLDKQGTGGTELPLFDGLGDTFQTLTPSGTYVLTADILNDFGQRFTAASGTDDLAYQWRASSGYRSDGDGLWAGNATLLVVEVEDIVQRGVASSCLPLLGRDDMPVFVSRRSKIIAMWRRTAASTRRVE